MIQANITSFSGIDQDETQAAQFQTPALDPESTYDPQRSKMEKKDDADEKIALKSCHLDEQPIRPLLVLTGAVFFCPFEGTHHANFVLEFLKSPAQASFYPNRLKIHRLFWQAAACPYTKPSPFQAETCSLTEYRNRLIARAQIKPTASETSNSED